MQFFEERAVVKEKAAKTQRFEVIQAGQICAYNLRIFPLLCCPSFHRIDFILRKVSDGAFRVEKKQYEGLSPPAEDSQLNDSCSNRCWRRIGEIRAQFNAMAWGPEDADYSTPESLGFDYAKFDCDPGLKREVEMMIEFRDIMDEKSALWQKSHKEWKAASGDWNKRWKEQLEKWNLEVRERDHLRVDASVNDLGDELARRL